MPIHALPPRIPTPNRPPPAPAARPTGDRNARSTLRLGETPDLVAVVRTPYWRGSTPRARRSPMEVPKIWVKLSRTHSWRLCVP